MAGADAGPFFRLYLPGTGNKILQKLGFFEIYFFYISLAKIATHFRKVFR
jgi:hypothetical protein